MHDNTVRSAREYLLKKLADHYETDEISLFFEWILMDLTGWARHELHIRQNERLKESQLIRLTHAMKALRAGLPIQYVLGHTEFYGLDISVDKRVLIPRPETEELVAWIIADMREQGRAAPSAIDLGTGSGAIALALKKEMPRSRVWGLDVSTDALEVARHNGAALELDVVWKEGDMCSYRGSDSWDIIVSNPPYIAVSESPTLESRVRDQEPHTALFVPDEDVVHYYRCVANFALEQGTSGGFLYVEIAYNRAPEVTSLFERLGLMDIQVRADLSGQERMIRARLKE